MQANSSWHFLLHKNQGLVETENSVLPLKILARSGTRLPRPLAMRWVGSFFEACAGLDAESAIAEDGGEDDVGPAATRRFDAARRRDRDAEAAQYAASPSAITPLSSWRRQRITRGGAQRRAPSPAPSLSTFVRSPLGRDDAAMAEYAVCVSCGTQLRGVDEADHCARCDDEHAIADASLEWWEDHTAAILPSRGDDGGMRHALQMRRGHAIHRKMMAGVKSGLEATAEIHLHEADELAYALYLYHSMMMRMVSGKRKERVRGDWHELLRAAAVDGDTDVAARNDAENAIIAKALHQCLWHLLNLWNEFNPAGERLPALGHSAKSNSIISSGLTLLELEARTAHYATQTKTTASGGFGAPTAKMRMLELAAMAPSGSGSGRGRKARTALGFTEVERLSPSRSARAAVAARAPLSAAAREGQGQGQSVRPSAFQRARLRSLAIVRGVKQDERQQLRAVSRMRRESLGSSSLASLETPAPSRARQRGLGRVPEDAAGEALAAASTPRGGGAGNGARRSLVEQRTTPMRSDSSRHYASRRRAKATLGFMPRTRGGSPPREGEPEGDSISESVRREARQQLFSVLAAGSDSDSDRADGSEALVELSARGRQPSRSFEEEEPADLRTAALRAQGVPPLPAKFAALADATLVCSVAESAQRMAALEDGRSDAVPLWHLMDGTWILCTSAHAIAQREQCVVCCVCVQRELVLRTHVVHLLCSSLPHRRRLFAFSLHHLFHSSHLQRQGEA